MAEHVHKTYTCDHCRTELESVPKHYPAITGRIEFIGEWASVGFKFEHLCKPCHDKIWQFFGKPQP